MTDANFEDYLRRELPRVIRTRLEREISWELYPIEEKIRGQMGNWIREATDAVFSNYRAIRDHDREAEFPKNNPLDSKSRLQRRMEHSERNDRLETEQPEASRTTANSLTGPIRKSEKHDLNQHDDLSLDSHTIITFSHGELVQNMEYTNSPQSTQSAPHNYTESERPALGDVLLNGGTQRSDADVLDSAAPAWKGKGKQSSMDGKNANADTGLSNSVGQTHAAGPPCDLYLNEDPVLDYDFFNMDFQYLDPKFVSVEAHIFD